MLGKLWLGVGISVILAFLYVDGQGPIIPPGTAPEQVQQIQEIQYRNYLLVAEQQRRLAGWRQFYVNRLPFEYLIPIYLLVLLILRQPAPEGESCPSLPTATTLGVFCCGSFTTQATCQASPQNADCTWDTGTCRYECSNFTTETVCKGVGCSWNTLLGICTT
ncbi:uncharacterized protein [Argopecten irradians]|uniref:uncharacterized protein n=1 Tax=Argopecten irradians TaxID=31199 RepID=UPI00371EAF64